MSAVPRRGGKSDGGDGGGDGGVVVVVVLLLLLVAFAVQVRRYVHLYQVCSVLPSSLCPARKCASKV